MKQNWPEGVKAIFGIKKIPGYVGGKSEVQSLIFDKNNWSIQKAKNWLAKHKFKFGKVDVTDRYIRFRQHDPKEYGKFAISNPPESVEKYLRMAVLLASRYYSDPDELLSELQMYLEDVVQTIYEEEDK